MGKCQYNTYSCDNDTIEGDHYCQCHRDELELSAEFILTFTSQGSNHRAIKKIRNILSSCQAGTLSLIDK